MDYGEYVAMIDRNNYLERIARALEQLADHLEAERRERMKPLPAPPATVAESVAARFGTL